MAGKVLSAGLKLIKQPVELTYNLTPVSGTRGNPSKDTKWPFQVNPYTIRATTEVIGVPVGTRVKVFSNKPFAIVNGTVYGHSYSDSGWITTGYHEITATYQLLSLTFKNEDESPIDAATIESRIVISKGV